MNPYMILAFVLALVGDGFYWNHHGAAARDTYWTAQVQTERADAAQAARKDEHDQQEKVNAALRKQNKSLGSINAGLVADLDGLRNRPERPADMPDTGRATCAGGSGAELSRTDAGFLEREAARGDKLRAALSACYEVIDARRP